MTGVSSISGLRARLVIPLLVVWQQVQSSEENTSLRWADILCSLGRGGRGEDPEEGTSRLDARLSRIRLWKGGNYKDGCIWCINTQHLDSEEFGDSRNLGREGD